MSDGEKDLFADILDSAPTADSSEPTDSPPAPSAVQYLCMIAGVEWGPLSRLELQALADQGQLQPTDRVCEVTSQCWMLGQDVPSLSFPHGSADGSTVSDQPESPSTSRAEPLGQSTATGQTATEDHAATEDTVTGGTASETSFEVDLSSLPLADPQESSPVASSTVAGSNLDSLIDDVDFDDASLDEMLADHAEETDANTPAKESSSSGERQPESVPETSSQAPASPVTGGGDRDALQSAPSDLAAAKAATATSTPGATADLSLDDAPADLPGPSARETPTTASRHQSALLSAVTAATETKSESRKRGRGMSFEVSPMLLALLAVLGAVAIWMSLPSKDGTYGLVMIDETPLPVGLLTITPSDTTRKPISLAVMDGQFQSAGSRELGQGSYQIELVVGNALGMDVPQLHGTPLAELNGARFRTKLTVDGNTDPELGFQFASTEAIRPQKNVKAMPGRK